MMSQTLLPFGCAGSVCNIEEAMTVLPYALLALGQVMRVSFPPLLGALQRSTRVALVCLVWGLTFHDKQPNPSSIASRLGTLSHDRLQRLRREDVGLSSMVLMLALVQRCLELMTSTPACATFLLLDDVFIPKPFARCIEGCYWDYNTTQKQHCFGLRLVVLFWSNGLLEIPIAFLVWHKRPATNTPASKAPIRLKPSSSSRVNRPEVIKAREVTPMPSFAPRLYRTKPAPGNWGNQLARILVWWTHRKGVRADVLLFDSWYANRDNFLLFDRLAGGVLFPGTEAIRGFGSVSGS